MNIPASMRRAVASAAASAKRLNAAMTQNLAQDQTDTPSEDDRYIEVEIHTILFGLGAAVAVGWVASKYGLN
jgi:hypothetical protein